eukprot:sb/3464736/
MAPLLKSPGSIIKQPTRRKAQFFNVGKKRRVRFRGLDSKEGDLEEVLEFVQEDSDEELSPVITLSGLDEDSYNDDTIGEADITSSGDSEQYQKDLNQLNEDLAKIRAEFYVPGVVPSAPPIEEGVVEGVTMEMIEIPPQPPPRLHLQSILHAPSRPVVFTPTPEIEIPTGPITSDRFAVGIQPVEERHKGSSALLYRMKRDSLNVITVPLHFLKEHLGFGDSKRATEGSSSNNDDVKETGTNNSSCSSKQEHKAEHKAGHERDELQTSNGPTSDSIEGPSRPAPASTLPSQPIKVKTLTRPELPNHQTGSPFDSPELFPLSSSPSFSSGTPVSPPRYIGPLLPRHNAEEEEEQGSTGSTPVYTPDVFTPTKRSHLRRLLISLSILTARMLSLILGNMPEGGVDGFLGCFLRYTLYESAGQGGSIRTDVIDVVRTVWPQFGG